ncbi:DUF2244 domain-containing protein [Sediminicurvatus halobius]|uniref:DUF2244 domain-containing protein n=1 Tax=Sediminicurvatus halobius TaxID=2182432 RepID=A0A2U2MYS1_9GAMM|nr:DUF2244 domain-containing protein [Spiribacter halobius]PWG61947.1 hypothetical protein DEM34_13875 [Spiribacter halobius]UEX78355.1 DUF2244 domain-containing protein [Spiribacter halobius]
MATSSAAPADERRFVLAPNIAPNWPQTKRIYAGLCAVCLTVAGACAAVGLWPVVPFAGLELAALGAALYVSARRSLDREVIRVAGNEVHVERGRGRVERAWHFERAWTEVLLQPPRRRWDPPLLLLRSRGRVLRVGEWLDDEELRSLARELAGCIGPMAQCGRGDGPARPTAAVAPAAAAAANPTQPGR